MTSPSSLRIAALTCADQARWPPLWRGHQEFYRAGQTRPRNRPRADRRGRDDCSRVWSLTHETNAQAMALYDKAAARSGVVQHVSKLT